MQKKLGIFLAVFMLCFMGSVLQSQAYTQTSGTVSAASAKIRQDANTSSAVLGSAAKGDTLTIIDEKTGSDGAVWYQVWVNADTKGYVRSDLVQKAGGSTPAATTTTQQASETTPALAKTDVTPMDSQAATITGGDVRVRSGAGTAYDTVSSAKKGTAITLTGTATGTDSQKWYQVSFINNGATVTGFIRADLVQIGAATTNNSTTTGASTTTPETTTGTTDGTTGTETSETSADGTQPTDGTQPAETEPSTENTDYSDLPEENAQPSSDYELVYTADNDGNNVWYLYNNAEGVRMKLDDLIAAGTTNATALEEAQGTASKEKLVIIIMAVVMVLMALAITLLAFKIHDLSDGYEDDDDEEDDEGTEEYDEEGELFRHRKVVKKAAKPERNSRSPYSQEKNGNSGKPINSRPVGARPQNGRPMPQGARSQGTRPQGTRPQNNGYPNGRPQGQRPAGQRPQQPGSRPVNPQNGQPIRPNGQRSQGVVPQNGRPVGGNPGQRTMNSKNQEVTWKSKNFLTDEDDMELSFLDHSNQDE